MAACPGRCRSSPGVRLAGAGSRSAGGAGPLENRDRSGKSVAPAHLAPLAHQRVSPGGSDIPGSSAGRVFAGATGVAPTGGVLVVPSVTVIGVGIDLVDLERVRALLASKGEKALTRFFSERERDYLATRTDATG